MINKEDLRIGNIVNYAINQKEGGITLNRGIITALTENKAIVNNIAIKYCNLYAITLTNDMFELLGFKLECEKIINLSEYVKNINGYNIRIGTYSNSIGKDFSIHIDNRDCDTILRADMQYLHQLQNHIYSATHEKLNITNIL